jgi:FAD/FMN-containing dehydrogenase
MGQIIQALKTQQVPLLEPGHAEYRQAIASSNLIFRFCRPDVVVRPKSAAHVQAIINEAKARSIQVTIKCNGHSYAGHSTALKGISLDLRDMKNAELDMNAMMVTMDAGCQWGDVYEKLITGSGLGPFTRSFGIGADTLAEATLVTANGSLVTVKESDLADSDNGRLFWALCGAGGGNFGVVVQMKIHVQKLSSRYGRVVAGRYQWFPQDGFTSDVLATMNEFYAVPWPNKLTIDTTWVCDLREDSNKGGVRFNVSFDGSKGEYD